MTDDLSKADLDLYRRINRDNMRKLRAERKKHGRCIACNQPARPFTYCLECRRKRSPTPTTESGV